MTNRIELQISDNTKLVAEINPDPAGYKEIFIGVEENGIWKQDLAIVGKPYRYDSDLHVVLNDGFRVLVYGDAEMEDYTNEFLIDEYEYEED